MHEHREIGLADAEFYRALSAEQLARVRGALVEKRFERGKALFFEGQPAALLWAIQSGEVRQYKSSPDGRITTLELLGAGQIFGALSAMEEGIYPASAEGVVSGVAWCLPRNSFLRLIGENPTLSHEILRIVSQRLCTAQERVRSLAHDAAPRRLAQALLRVSQGGEAHVTRRALAESAGTTVETAIRVLRGFERDRLIEGRVGQIRILDRSALDRIAGG